MDETVDGTRELLKETVQAFKTGMRGDEYVPGSGGSPGLLQDEELAKLEELHDSGTLSDEEFAAARARLLNGGDPT
ncbi:MAG TPA: SHOCT domain-containing protein [Chloroflexota bacterium]|nr:SHOCT domain-containing protein [Chloroflexota bacterium]